MVWLSLMIVFFIIGTIGFVVGKMSKPMDEHGQAGGGKIGGYGTMGACILGAVILTLVTSINIVDAGHVGGYDTPVWTHEEGAIACRATRGSRGRAGSARQRGR